MRVQKGPRLLALLAGSLFTDLELLVEDLNPSDVRSEQHYCPRNEKGALQNLVRFLINIPSCPFEKSIKALFTANYFICITKQLSTSPRPPHWKF